MEIAVDEKSIESCILTKICILNSLLKPIYDDGAFSKFLGSMGYPWR
jgi:hypothetical protein